jgi:alginate O-acetyltransferase complex protein AlgI
MLFNSPAFLFCFLPVVVLLVLLANRFSLIFGRVVLAMASLYFYSQGDLKHLGLLLASTLVNHWIGAAIQTASNEASRKRWLVIGVSANLLNLAFFKYLNFFSGVVSELTQMSALQTHVLLPLGISFYTFTQIAYLVDSAAGKVKEKSLIDYALFVWYFPHQIAGPILHHKEMLSQFRSSAFGVDSRRVLVGCCIVGLGLFKKVVMADWFERVATPIFNAAGHGVTPGFFEGWAAAGAYALQIYFDFSAYCDMAVGVSFMFGIRLPANFDSPYKSLSIVEFWRRWHLTLSRFLRDYLYIPLGGNRHGEGRRQLNLMATMVLGGFWHGASWNFLIWGALHGSFLAGNHYWRKSALSQRLPLPRWLCWALTMFAVVNAWVFFRANTLPEAFTLLRGMYGEQGITWPMFMQNLLPWVPASDFSSLWVGSVTRSFHVATIALALLWCAISPNINQWFAIEQPILDSPEPVFKRHWAMSALGVLFTAVVAGWAISRLGEDSAFIYFNF